MTTGSNLVTIRPLLIKRGLEAGLLIAVIASLVGLWKYAQHIRGEVSGQQLSLQRAPEFLVHQTALESEFSKYDHDIARIRGLFIRRDALGELISQFEEQARKTGVEVRVPDIAEEKKAAGAQPTATPTGPYVDITLTVQATGDPVKLLQFFHSLEHLPYAIRATSWRLSTRSVVPLSAHTLAVPHQGPGGIPRPSPEAPHSMLEVKFLVTLINDD